MINADFRTKQTWLVTECCQLLSYIDLDIVIKQRFIHCLNEIKSIFKQNYRLFPDKQKELVDLYQAINSLKLSLFEDYELISKKLSNICRKMDIANSKCKIALLK